MKCLIVQLSDVHLHGPLDPILSRASAIAASVYKQHIDCDATCIVLSGDVAFSGVKAEYDEAKSLLNKIVADLQAQKQGDIRLVIAPGNHDCDFSRDSFPRTATIEHLIKLGAPQIDEATVNTCTAVQDPFFSFLRDLTSKEFAGLDRMSWTSELDLGGRVIRFNCLNVAWMSSLNERYGRLHFPTSRIRRDRNGSEIEIFVLHHPLNWFIQGNMHDMRAELRHSADFVLTGHEHVQNATIVDDAVAGQSGFLEAGALSSDDCVSSFNVIEIDLGNDQFQSSLYELTEGGEYIARETSPSWQSFRALPAKRLVGFQVSTEFRKTLSDPGARFNHPVKGELVLDDFYVFPDLRRMGQKEGDAGERSSSNTILGKGVADRLVLVGEEKVGKTSLLYQLFKGFHEQGLIPVYIQAGDLSSSSEKEIQAAITKAVRHQYGEGAEAPFWAKKVEERVCLIDDYDRLRGNERYRYKLVAEATKYFKRVVVTTIDAFQLEEYVSGSTAATFKSFETHRVLPLGHRLRYQLIRKWTCGGMEASMPLSQMMAAVDRCERMINSVLGESFVPSMPLYLLTLLQSAEAGANTNLAQSAAGHYYGYLITRGLNEAKVRPEELDDLFNYCAHLAFEFEKLDLKAISLPDFRSFTDLYAKTYTPVAFDKRLAQLRDAGVIVTKADCVEFRYPYYRYYFLGKYYADQIHKTDRAVHLIDTIRKKCRNLHIRENANTILFLTHHTKEPFILEEIVQVLSTRFEARAPIRFEEDVQSLGGLIESTSKIAIEELDVERNREKVRALQDEIEDGRKGDGTRRPEVAEELEGQIQIQTQSRNVEPKEAGLQLAAGKKATEDNEMQEAANLLADLNVLFKTVELLGQILKSYYGSLTIERKKQLMKQLFDGPLRALADFFEFLGARKEVLVTEIAAELGRQDKESTLEEREQLARRIVFDIIGVMSVVFVSKSAEAVNAAPLRDLTREVANEKGTVAAKIIQLAAILDSSETVPIGELRDLLKRVEGNIFSKRLIESFVFHHTYMFPTDHVEKQQLHELMEFDIKRMRAVDLKTKPLKLTKK